MPEPRDILLWVVLLPAAVAVIATLVSLIPGRRDSASQPWGPALAICAGFVAAYTKLKGIEGFPPVNVQTWLVYLGVPVVLIAIIATVSPRRARWIVFALSVTLIVLSVWLFSRPLARSLEPREFWTRTAFFAAGAVAWLGLMEALASRVKGATLPLLLWICAVGAALAVINAHSLLLGQLVGTVAAALGAIALLGLWFRNLTLARGGVLALAVVLLGLILCGHLYADLSQRDLILLAAAPLMAWAGELPFLKRGGVRFAVRLIAVLLVLAIPLVPALKGLQQTMQEQTDAYSY
ncbi:MAG: hypothetical protein ABIP55_14805 [Tepidisphaeraceae bacterium]